MTQTFLQKLVSVISSTATIITEISVAVIIVKFTFLLFNPDALGKWVGVLIKSIQELAQNNHSTL